MPHVDYIGPDGSKWPSATELTQLLPQDWIWAWYKSAVKKEGYAGWEKCLAASDKGKEVGTEAHDFIERCIQDQELPEVDSFGAEIGCHLFAALDPLIELYLCQEVHLKSEELRTHGTVDVITKMRDCPGLWIGDWKTSAKASPTHPIQLAIYAMCWNEQNPDRPIDNGWIARVDKKSKNLNVKIDQYTALHKYFPIVKALRAVYDYHHKEGPWKPLKS